MAAFRRELGRLRPESTVFLLCDVQERFRDLIWQMPTVIRTSGFLVAIAQQLKIPVVVTEQYSKVFGSTVAELGIAARVEAGEAKVFEKRLFSMLTEEVVAHLLEPPAAADAAMATEGAAAAAVPPMEASAAGRYTNAVLFGIETHVCVQQTCLDLLERGVGVTLVVDGVSSQRPLDRAVALKRLAAAGAVLTTAESLLFELLRSSDSAVAPAFKPCTKLLKEHNEAHEPDALAALLAAM